VKLKESNITQLIREGREKEAIQNLYKTVLPYVKKYIKKNDGNVDDAFDIFQDAVLAFYQSVIENRFNEKYKVHGYVYKLCVFRWTNKVQREKLQYQEELPDMIIEEPKAWFSETEHKEEEAVLRNLFSAIGDRCLELLTYTIYKNMLLEDVMLRMSFPTVTAVKMQHHRCKEKLINEIKKNPEILSKLRNI
jgi:RNA polymerase sigma factor (sigma-70 family)